MDPAVITNPLWTDIGNLLKLLWVLLFFVIVFASNLLLGHILIPTLVATRHLPERVAKLRPMFYGVSILALVVVAFIIVRIADLAHVLKDFYPRWFL